MSSIYTVVSTEKIANQTTLFNLQVSDQDESLAFAPGQYAAVSFRQNGKIAPLRYYALASSPAEKGIVRLAVRESDKRKNAMSRAVKPGDSIGIDGPYGEFYFNPTRDKAAVYIADDTGGINAFLSMAIYATQKKLKNELCLFYMCRTENDVAFLEELTTLEEMNPHIHVVIAVERGTTERLTNKYVISGDINTQIVAQVIKGAFRRYSFFISVNDALMPTLFSELEQAGARPEYIYTQLSNLNDPSHLKTPLIARIPKRAAVASAAACLLLVAGIVRAQIAPHNNASQSVKPDTATASMAKLVSSAKPSVAFEADKPSITAGEPVQLEWKATSTATARCTATGGWQGILAANGRQTVNPKETTTYTLTCKNTKGSEAKTVTVTVKPAENTGMTFAAANPTLAPGTTTALTWKANNVTGVCKASDGWTGDKAPSGSTTITPAKTTTYTLTCPTATTPDVKSVTVTVNEPTPPAAPPAAAAAPAPAAPAPVLRLTVRSTMATVQPDDPNPIIFWSATSNVDSVERQITCRGAEALSGHLTNAGSSDSIKVGQRGSGDVRYGITCSAPGMQDNTQVVVVRYL